MSIAVEPNQARPRARPWQAVRAAASALCDLALPLACGGCGALSVGWCAGCAQTLTAMTYDDGARAVWPSPSPVGMPVTFAAMAYQGPLRSALTAFKDHGRADLAPTLGTHLAVPILRAWQAAVFADARVEPGSTSAHDRARGHPLVVLCPIPGSRASVRRRGRSPLTELLDVALAQIEQPSGPRLTPTPPVPRGEVATGPGAAQLLVLPLLQLQRTVADQSRLDTAQRQQNLDHAMSRNERAWRLLGAEFNPRQRPSQRRGTRAICVIVVDDIVTTGATLAEAARVLRAGGVSHVSASVIAATQRRAPAGIAQSRVHLDE